ncbi:MAG: NTP transferase domain-containing protein [Desulfurococcales archaeon]|nr:NTP transferase domain-containing protein [Desulfurococcales archaeon]
MIAVIMAGGRATRMGGIVKPLLDVCGSPLLLHVARAAGKVARLKVLALSPHTIDPLKMYCSTMECIKTPGAGYAEDLSLLLRAITYRPLLVLPADLAHIDGKVLKDLVEAAQDIEEDIATMTCRGEPQGVSIVKGNGPTWANLEAQCTHVNVNTWKDLEEARRRCVDTEARLHQEQ